MHQQLKSEHTKNLILDQAFKQFYKNGFKTTSIDQIMRETKLSKGAFYHHYQSKKDLGLTVILTKVQERLFKGMIEPLLGAGKAITILEDTFIHRIRSFSATEKKHGCPMNNLINEVGDYEQVYQLTLKNLIDEWTGALVTLIDRAKEEKTIATHVSSRAIATYLISAFEGVRGLRKLYNDDNIIDEYIEGLRLYIKQLHP